MLAGVNLAFLVGGTLSNAERMAMAKDLAALTFLLTPLATVILYGQLWYLYRGISRYAALNAAFQVGPTHALVLNQAGSVVKSTRGLESHPDLKSKLLPYLQSSTAVPCDSGGALSQAELSIDLYGARVECFCSINSVILASGQTIPVAILEDITELKQDLGQHNEFFEITPDALMVLGSDGLILRTNKTLEAILGCDTSILTARTFTDLIHPDDRQSTIEVWQECRESNIPFNSFENRLIASDGSVHWLAWSGVPVAQEQTIYAIGRDITEQRRKKRALEEQAAQVRNQLELLALAQDSVIVRQLDNRITMWNRGAEQNYGWTKQEALGANYHALLRSEYTTSVENIEKELLVRGYWHGEADRLTRDGSRIVVSCQWVMELDPSGHPAAILEISQDITQPVELAELFPFRNDEQRIRAAGRFVCIRRTNEFRELFADFFHCLRIVGLQPHAFCLQLLYQFDRWGKADIVGIGFERQTENTDLFPFEHP